MEEERKIKEVEENGEEKYSDLKTKYDKVINILMKVRDVFTKIGEATKGALERMGEIDKKFLGESNTEQTKQFSPDIEKINDLL